MSGSRDELKRLELKERSLKILSRNHEQGLSEISSREGAARDVIIKKGRGFKETLQMLSGAAGVGRSKPLRPGEISLRLSGLKADLLEISAIDKQLRGLGDDLKSAAAKMKRTERELDFVGDRIKDIEAKREIEIDELESEEAASGRTAEALIGGGVTTQSEEPKFCARSESHFASLSGDSRQYFQASNDGQLGAATTSNLSRVIGEIEKLSIADGGSARICYRSALGKLITLVVELVGEKAVRVQLLSHSEVDRRRLWLEKQGIVSELVKRGYRIARFEVVLRSRTRG